MIKKAFMRYKQKETDVVFGLKKGQEELKKILYDFQRFCDDHDISFSLSYGSLIGAAREKDIIEWDNDIDVMVKFDAFDKIEKLSNKLNSYGLSMYSFKNTKGINTEEIRIYRPGFYRIVEENGKRFITPLCIDVFFFAPISVEPGKINPSQERILKIIEKNKRILTMKYAKYDSKSPLRRILRRIKKILYSVYQEKHLHESVLSNIKMLYVGNDYLLFSPFACETFKKTFSKDFLDNIIKAEFGEKEVSIIADYDNFLTKVYGDWKTPKDRSSGKVYNCSFVYREE